MLTEQYEQDEQVEEVSFENFPSPDGTWKIVMTCVDCPEPDVADLSEMIDNGETIDYDTFVEYVDPESLVDIEQVLGYGPGQQLSLKTDYAVSFERSYFRDIPVVFFVWSAIEHVFADPNLWRM